MWCTVPRFLLLNTNPLNIGAEVSKRSCARHVLGFLLMAKQEDIGAEVRNINLDVPSNLLLFAEEPYSFDALVKLKNNYTGPWRDKVIAFCDSVKETYNVEYIKQEVNAALQSRSKLEKFFANTVFIVILPLAIGFAFWRLFNLGTGILLAIVLFVCFFIGYNSVNEESKKLYSGDTLKIVKDFEKVIK